VHVIAVGVLHWVQRDGTTLGYSFDMTKSSAAHQDGSPEHRRPRQYQVLAQMNRLINELLDAAGDAKGLPAKGLPLVRENVNVTGLLRAALQAWGPVAHAKRIVLSTRPPGAPLYAVLDEHRIMQTLSNLLSNAIKFTPDGGQVRLEASGAGPDVRFAVTDTGTGLSDAECSKVLERVHHDAADRSRRLGLQVSRQIVEAHGGSLAVDNHRGNGSTFYFLLPRLGGRVA
jgi:signal transduction histidine kinase